MRKTFSVSKYIKILGDNLPFEIGQKVYHSANSDHPPGVIVDYRVYGTDGTVEYIVSYGPGQIGHLHELELSSEKVIE